MGIRIDRRELMEVLTWTPREQNIMLVGKHGIGKSQILTNHYQDQGMRVITFFLGQMSDPGDLIGLPHKKPETGHSEFLPPFWWPLNGEPIVLFLDELNRARPELLQAIQDLTLNRQLAGRSLPEGSVVISAINVGDEYQLTDLDPALLSRFNIYDFAPSVEDWVDWAQEVCLDSRVIQFIEKNSDFLDGQHSDNDDSDIEKIPDRRAWARVSDIIKPHTQINLPLAKLISGVVGVTVAMEFKKFVEAFQRISPERILLNFSKKLTSEMNGLPLQEITVLNRDVLRWLEKHAPTLDEKKRHKVLVNMQKFLNYLQNTDRREAVAELFNQVESDRFVHARELLLTSPAIYQLLERFLESVEL